MIDATMPRCRDAKLPAGWRSAPRILCYSWIEVWMHNNSRRERSSRDQSTGLDAKCSPAARMAVGGWQLAAPGPGAICWVAWVNHTAACPVQVQGGTQQLSDAAPRLSSSIFKLLADAVRLCSIQAWTTSFSTTAVAHRQCGQVNICAGARYTVCLANSRALTWPS
jgi:hypothetical protein